jgi:predicted PurR-regulated permease PerM
VDQANKAAASIVRAAGATPAAPTAAAGEEKPKPLNLWTLVFQAPRVIASVLAVVLLAYFFLVYGQDLQRQAIARLPADRHKQITVDILRRIETDLSRYVLTISFINVCLGMVLTAALYWMGIAIGDALLWGFLWGVAGLLLAVPLLASMKIVAERVPRLEPWARLIE